MALGDLGAERVAGGGEVGALGGDLDGRDVGGDAVDRGGAVRAGDAHASEDCYGVGPADGLTDDADVLVTNAEGKKIGLGEITGSTGGKRGAAGGACRLDWDVDVPAEAPGVLTVMWAGNPNWTQDFTMAEAIEKPGMFSLTGIGDINQ